MFLGNCKKNKWCCFCKNWLDPSLAALKPKPGGLFFEVDNTKRCKCMVKKIETNAIFSCQKFENKFNDN